MLLPVLAMLSGCATLDGAPAPLFTVAKTNAMIKSYNPDDVVTAMQGKSAADRDVYRDRVVAAYLAAIDARYEQFRRELSSTRKAGGVGFDFLTLGLTGAGSVWASAATKLSAGATAVAGARASLDRQLYQERTMGTIISYMDANRLAVRTQILRGLAQSETAYPIERAFADLAQYEAAASIDRAMNQAAAAAGANGDKVAKDYSTAAKFCKPAKDVGDARKKFFADVVDPFVEAAKAEAADKTDRKAPLTKAATRLGWSAVAGQSASDAIDAQGTVISDAALKVCSSDQLTSFEQQLAADGVK